MTDNVNFVHLASLLLFLELVNVMFVALVQKLILLVQDVIYVLLESFLLIPDIVNLVRIMNILLLLVLLIVYLVDVVRKPMRNTLLVCFANQDFIPRVMKLVNDVQLELSLRIVELVNALLVDPELK